jgi:hypothetical protein
MSYEVTGATSVAADDAYSLAVAPIGGNQQFDMSLASVVTLTAGSNTFTTKYRARVSTCTVGNRKIFVMNLA